jgi:hypothetical protein
MSERASQARSAARGPRRIAQRFGGVQVRNERRMSAMRKEAVL